MTHAVGMKKRCAGRGVMTLVPWLARLAITAWVLSSLTSCESGIQPQPEPEYLLYAAMHGYSEGWIAVINCATDSVIDSITHGFQTGPGIVACPDGKYFAVLGSGRPPEIFDAVTRTPLTSLSAPSLPPVFLPSERIIICPQFDSSLVYNIPGFNLKEVWARPRWMTGPLGSSGRVASADNQHDSMSHPSYQYVVFDSNGAPIDSFAIRPDSGTLLQVDLPFTFSQDGTHFYGIAFGNVYPVSLAGYDLANHSLVFLQRTGYIPHDCRVSPDGREVWTADYGDRLGWDPDHKPSVHVYDAVTGVLKDTVSLSWSEPGFAGILRPWSIRFLPNSDKVYINSVRGPILVVNSRTKKLYKLIFSESGRFTEDIDLAPRP